MSDVSPDGLAGSSSSDMLRPMSESPPEVVSELPDYITSCAVRRPPGPGPRWRLARKGPFPSERSSPSLHCFGDGCAFRNTTYRPSDYATPTGEFGVPMHQKKSSVSGMDWRAGVCQYVGNGTGDVAAFSISGSSHGCSSPAT